LCPEESCANSISFSAFLLPKHRICLRAASKILSFSSRNEAKSTTRNPQSLKSIKSAGSWKLKSENLKNFYLLFSQPLISVNPVKNTLTLRFQITTSPKPPAKKP
jgi:hypothetical protein